MDIVYLHGLKCESTIGVWDWEKAVLQTLTLDIDLATDTGRAAASDTLEDALDYQAITKRVCEFAKANRFALIETMAEQIAELILDEFDTAWVRVKLDKGRAVASVQHVGVIIERGTRPSA